MICAAAGYGTALPLCQELNVHAYVINEMGAHATKQKWCDNNNGSVGAKGFGW